MTDDQLDSSATLGMQDGVVAYLDILGFKGMWERVGHAQILAKLHQAADAANSASTAFVGMAGRSMAMMGGQPRPVDVRAVPVSDGLFILATFGQVEEPDAEARRVAQVSVLSHVVLAVACCPAIRSPRIDNPTMP